MAKIGISDYTNLRLMQQQEAFRGGIIEEEEAGQSEQSLGKYSYDVLKKKWKAHPSTSLAFPNAFKACEPIADSHAGDNKNMRDLIELKFKFKIDKEKVMKQMPGACIVLRTTYELKQSPGNGQQDQKESNHQVIHICIDDDSNQLSEISIPRAKLGNFTYESIFGEHDNDEGQLIYRIENSRDSICINTIELIAIRQVPVTGLISSKRLQSQAKSAQLNNVLSAQSNLKMVAQSLQNDETAVRSRNKLIATSHTLDSGKIFDQLDMIRSKPQEKDSFMISGGMQNQDEPKVLSEVEERTEEIHSQYNLATQLKQMKGLDDYQRAVQYKIPLDELYELWATCLHTSDCNFCAVLLKIKDPQIKNLNDPTAQNTKKESGGKKNEQFLLQIWKRGGQMIFEKSLKHPVCNWNMTGEYFLFQEKPSIPEIYLVKIFENESSRVHKFKLHPSVVVNQVNSYYDSYIGKLIVPPEDIKTEELENLMKGNESAFSREHFSFVTDTEAGIKTPSEKEKYRDEQDKKKAEERFESTPFCKRFSHDIINRAPDKMCDFIDGFIVLAYRQIIYYFDIRKYILTDSDGYTPDEVAIPLDQIRQIPLMENKKIICFPELNSEQSCIVIEDLETRDVSFLAFKLVDDTSKTAEPALKMNDIKLDSIRTIEEEDEFNMRSESCKTSISFHRREFENLIDSQRGSTEKIVFPQKEQMQNMPGKMQTRASKESEVLEPKKMKLIGLSVKDAVPQHEQEQEDYQEKEEKKHKLLKFRSTALLDDNGTWSQVSLLLREDGRVEIYADFLYVGQIYDEKRPCIDIEAGARNFFFKQVDRDYVRLTNDPAMIRRAFNRTINNDAHKTLNRVIFRSEDYSENNINVVKDQNENPDRYNANLIFMHPDDVKEHTQISRVEKRWKNRISKGYMLKEKILDGWEEVLHERVAPFFKLYTAIENIGTFLIVSHRNMLSVYNMGEKEENVVENEDEKSSAWVDTVQVSECNYHICKLSIVKHKDAHVKERGDLLKHSNTKRFKTKNIARGKKGKHGQVKHKVKDNMLQVEKFDICCLVGQNKLIYLQIDENGKFRVESYFSNVGEQKRLRQTVKEFEDQRVLQLYNDKSHVFGMIILLEQTVSEEEKENKKKQQEMTEISHFYYEEGSQFINFKQLECYIYKFPPTEKDDKSKLKVVCVNKEREDLLLTSMQCAEEMHLTRSSTVGLRFARKADFEVKKVQRGMICEVRETFAKTLKEIRVFAIANHGVSKLWPILKKKDKKIKLLTGNKKNSKTYNAEGKENDQKVAAQDIAKVKEMTEKSTKKLSNNFQVNQPILENNNVEKAQESNKDEWNQDRNDDDDQEQDVLLEEFYLTNAEFKEDRGCYIRISKDQILIFTPEKKLMFSITGFKFEAIIEVKQTYLYSAENHNDEAITIWDTKKEKPTIKQVNQREGLYVYSIKALLQGNVEPYLISSQGTGGGATLLHYNQTQGRLAFMEDYNTIVIVPLPQLNVINFIRMKNKQHYLIWREKRGFFTALNKKGTLHTWSIVSGALLYDEQTTLGSELESYQVYQSDENDITYTTNAYNLPEHSLTLLVTKKSVSEIAKTSTEKVEDGHEFQIKKPKLNDDTAQKTLEKEIKSLQGMDFEACSDIFLSGEEGIDFTSEDSGLVLKLHRFKVMQLKTYEDNQPRMSNCRVLFEFDHPLIQIKKSGINATTQGNSMIQAGAHNEEEAKKTNHPNESEAEKDNEQTLQRLYLSRDTTLLMEVIQNKFALVYKRTYKQTVIDENGVAVDYDYDDDSEEMDKIGSLVRWEVLYKIRRWPSDLTKQTSAPFMFSPNFKFQFDYDSRKKQIMIFDTQKQNVYLWMKKGMINTEWANCSQQDTLPLIFSRIWWVQDDEKDAQFHIVTQNNLDCIFRIIESEDESERDLELISVCKIDNLFTDSKKTDSPHFFHEPYPLESIHVTERLIRMNQNYKREMQHARNMNRFEKDDDGEDQIVKYMVEHVQKIDYTQSWSKLDTYFQIEMSYTWLDWLIIEEAINNKQFKMKDVSDQSKLQLAQNVLPNGKGILHMLAGNTSASMQHILIMTKNLFSFSSLQCDLDLLYVDEPVQLEIPFLNDYKLRTPLDICLDVQKYNSKELCPATTKLFCSPRKFIQQLQKKDREEVEQIENMKDRTTTRNVQLADVILENIKEYSLLHSSQQILDSLIEGTRLGLPNISNYLDSRIMPNQHKRLSMSYPKMKVNYLKNECTVIDGEYGTIPASIFGPIEEITKNIFKKKGAKQQTRVETIDLPELFQQCDRGRAFIEALTECKDSEFFTNKSVQVLIDHHYYFWYKINLFSVLVPAFFQLILFWAWSNFILPIRLKTIQSQNQESVLNATEELPSIYMTEQTFNYGDLNAYFQVLLQITTLYLFCYDFTVLAPNLWNFNTNNSAPSALPYAIFNLLLHLLVFQSLANADDDGITQASFWQAQSWVALAVWQRFVQTYLGEIKEFSWLVGLIKYSCTTTIYFLIVFASLVTSFTDSFNALDQKLIISGDAYDGETDYELRQQRAEDLDVSIAANFKKWLIMWQIGFRASIGNFNADEIRHYGYIDWLVFFLMCFLLIILMLNLLISVITEAHQNYLNAKIQSIYLQKALQIQKNGNSFLWFIFKEEAVPLKMLNIVLQASSKQEMRLLLNVDTQEGQITQILEQVDQIADDIEVMQNNNDDQKAEADGRQNNTRTKSRKNQSSRVSSAIKRVQEDFMNTKAINESILEHEDEEFQISPKPTKQLFHLDE